MSETRARPERLEFPAFSGRVVVDSVRGQARERAWPRKRGTIKNAKTLEQMAWFRRVVELTKFAAPTQQIIAIAAAKGSGLYPRDLLTMAISQGLYDILEPSGRLITYQRPQYEELVFTGAILRLTSNVNLTAGVNLVQSWPLPVRDTTDFWNAGAPTLFTIPAGIETVEFFAGSQLTAAKNAYLTHFIDSLGGRRLMTTRDSGSAVAAIASSTGPVMVTEGEQFKLTIRCGVSATLDASLANYFSLNVLGTL